MKSIAPCLLILSLGLSSCTSEETGLTDLERARMEYQRDFIGPLSTETGWTGNVQSCSPGTLDPEFLSAVMTRLNYFRRMAGLTEFIFDEERSLECQACALIQHANNGLSHNPSSSANCWTQEGAEASGYSGLAIGDMVSSVGVFIRDPGAENAAVGHRRLVMDGRRTHVAYGSTDNVCCLTSYGQANANELPVFSAYPPEGYVPSNLIFERWSFSIPGADFSDAIVEMWNNEGSMTLEVVTRPVDAYGNAIVWEPQDLSISYFWNKEYADIMVRISNIWNADLTSYSYTVRGFSPN